jgi:hypothetical protein
MSFSSLYSPFVFDEVFIFFRLAPELAFGDISLWHSALEASTQGWNTGRWVPFTTHLLSSTGVLLTYKFSDLFNINIIYAYGLMRMTLNVLISITTLRVLEIIFKNNQFERFSNIFLKLLAIILPFSMSTNSPYASGRSFVWSYSILFLLSLVLALLLLTIGKYIILAKAKPQALRELFVLVAIAALSIFQAISYEITQVMLIFSYILFIYLLRFSAPKVSYFRTQHDSILRVIKSRYSILYLSSALIALFVVRWHAYLICKSGCYSATDLNPSYFKIENLANNFFGALPFYSIPVSLNNIPNWADFTSFKLMIILITLLLTFYLANIMIRFALEPLEYTFNGRRLVISSIFFISIGFTLVFLFSLANSINRDSLGGIGLGKSGRISLMTNYGVALIYLGIIIFLINFIRSWFSRKIQKSIILFLSFSLSLILSLNFIGNLLTARMTLSSDNEYFLQSRFANSISYPDFSKRGDADRCNEIKALLDLYPSWYGADIYTIEGLYSTMNKVHGIPFCSTSIEKLFENYRGIK